jgi:hypothetical protein
LIYWDKLKYIKLYVIYLFVSAVTSISNYSHCLFLLVEEIAGVPGENHRHTLSHTVVSSTPRHHWASAGWELLTISALTLTLTFNNSPNHDQQNLSNSLNTKKGGTTICEVGNIGIK